MDVTVANCNELGGGKVVLDNVVMCANIIVLLTAQSSVWERILERFLC